MTEKLVKEARIVKRKGKWCVIGHKKDKTGKYRNFGCYDSKEEATKRLGQIYAFKHKKGEVIDTLHQVSGVLYEQGIIHVADALIGCINSIIRGEPKNFVAVKLGKIIALMQKKGQNDLSEQLESLLPEVLTLETSLETTGTSVQIQYRISAQRAYNIASLLKKKYAEGKIGESDFEYAKMKELESLLKAGFILPTPKSYKELPTDAESWWDHFSKR